MTHAFADVVDHAALPVIVVIFNSPHRPACACRWGLADHKRRDVARRLAHRRQHTLPETAWFYPEPKPEAHLILGRAALWKGVVVE